MLKVSGIEIDECGCLRIPVYKQETEPTLNNDNALCIWVNTGDNNKTNLVFRLSEGTQLKVELS